jgi:AcrR family transcriptional regulator
MATAPRTTATRDRRRAKLSDEIEVTALRLFALRGFSEVTVDEIADAANISTRTFFRYFATKEDLVLGGIIEQIDGAVSALAERPSGEPAVTALRFALSEVADDASDRHSKIDRWRAAVMIAEPGIAERGLQLLMRKHGEMTALVARRMEVDPGSDLRPGIITAAMVGALRAGWHEGVARGRIDQLPVLTAEALDLLAPHLSRLAQTT